MRVYVKQYDDFWSLSYSEWIALCQEASKGGGYDLKGLKKLKRKPKGIVRDPKDGIHFAVSNTFIFVEPLDWYAEDFAEWISEHSLIDQDKKKP